MNARAPKDFSELLVQWRQLQKDIAFVRRLPNLQVVTSGGKVRRIVDGLGGDDLLLDLRDKSSAISQSLTTPQAAEDWDPITVIWINRATAINGSFTTRSKKVQDAFVRALKLKTYYSKIVYMMTFLGGNIATARVPIIDTLGLGAATNHGFVDADFNEQTGIQGAGTKWFEPRLTPGNVNSGNIGYGWWELQNPFVSGAGNVDMMGCYNHASTTRNTIDSRTSSTDFGCGTPPGVVCGTTTVSGHYYGQRASATSRKGYKDGILTTNRTTSDTNGAPTDNQILISGGDEGLGGGKLGWGGRGRVAYVTDGSLTDAEVQDLHLLISSSIVSGIVTSGGTSTTYPAPGSSTTPAEDDCETCINKILVSRDGGVLTSRNAGQVLLTSNT